MNESSTAAQTAASATSPTPADTEPMTITVHLSSAAREADRTAWQSMLERVADRISDEVFEAGGAINIGDCGRPWCTVGNLDDGEGGEHARHHVSKSVELFDTIEEATKASEDLTVGGPWWAYLLQKPGALGFDSTNVVFSNDGRYDFEIPVWQLTVLRDLFEQDSTSRKAIADLLRQAADDGGAP